MPSTPRPLSGCVPTRGAAPCWAKAIAMGPAGGEGQHCRRPDDRGHGKRGTSGRGAADPLRSDGGRGRCPALCRLARQSRQAPVQCRCGHRDRGAVCRRDRARRARRPLAQECGRASCPAPPPPWPARTPPVHGAVLHPGATRPEGGTDEDTTLSLEDRQVRVRRWNNVHFARAPKTGIDVVRVDDPLYKRPLLIGTTARELTTAEMRQAYGHRWPVETNFFVAQGTCAREQPRAWTELAVSRRISLALLCGAVLKAIAAACGALPMGPGTAKLAVRRGGWRIIWTCIPMILRRLCSLA